MDAFSKGKGGPHRANNGALAEKNETVCVCVCLCLCHWRAGLSWEEQISLVCQERGVGFSESAIVPEINFFSPFLETRQTDYI